MCPPAEPSWGVALCHADIIPHQTHALLRGKGFVLVLVCGVCRLLMEEAARCHSCLVPLLACGPFLEGHRQELEKPLPSVLNWKSLCSRILPQAQVGAAPKEGNGEGRQRVSLRWSGLDTCLHSGWGAVEASLTAAGRGGASAGGGGAGRGYMRLL